MISRATITIWVMWSGCGPGYEYKPLPAHLGDACSGENDCGHALLCVLDPLAIEYRTCQLPCVDGQCSNDYDACLYCWEAVPVGESNQETHWLEPPYCTVVGCSD